MKKGDLLGYFQYLEVEEVRSYDESILVNVEGDKNHQIQIGRDVFKISKVFSADEYTSEIKVTATEIAKIFAESVRLPMTVKFRTKRKESDAKKWLEEILDNNIETGVTMMKEFLRGDERTMRGRHYGTWSKNGSRVQFVDMDIRKKEVGDYDNRFRQVDPRTVYELIVNGVKHTLKK